MCRTVHDFEECAGKHKAGEAGGDGGWAEIAKQSQRGKCGKCGSGGEEGGRGDGVLVGERDSERESGDGEDEGFAKH